MKRMFILELKNCLNRNEFKLIFLIMMLISVGSFLFYCFNPFGGYGSSMIEVRSAYELSLIQGVTTNFLLITLCFLLPLFAIIIYSDSYFSDTQSGVYKSILTRTNPRVYLWAKALVISIVTFLTFFLPLILNQLLCLITFPIQGFDNNYALPPYDLGIQNYQSHIMFDLLRIQSPFLYNLVYMLLISLVASCFALFAYAVYFVVKKGKFTVISGIFIIFVISQILVGQLISYDYSLINIIRPPTLFEASYVLLLWITILLIPSLVVITMKSLRDEVGIES